MLRALGTNPAPPPSEEHLRAHLAAPGEPDTSRAEGLFEQLQQRYPPRGEYGYDARSTWRRGVERSVALTGLPGMDQPGRSVLEIGCGDGMLGVALQSFGHRVTLTDVEDWRDARARELPFALADGCARLPFGDGSFCLVCSYNAFEHVDNPAWALAEAVRVTRPGGLIFLEFGPLYRSAWGLHAYRTLRMPYPQFLFSEAFIARRLEELGIWDLGKKRTQLQPMNRWSLAQFKALWAASGCHVVKEVLGKERAGLELLPEFPEAFRGRGLTWEDLVTSWIAVTLQKPGPAEGEGTGSAGGGDTRHETGLTC